MEISSIPLDLPSDGDGCRGSRPWQFLRSYSSEKVLRSPLFRRPDSMAAKTLFEQIHQRASSLKTPANPVKRLPQPASKPISLPPERKTESEPDIVNRLPKIGQEYSFREYNITLPLRPDPDKLILRLRRTPGCRDTSETKQSKNLIESTRVSNVSIQFEGPLTAPELQPSKKLKFPVVSVAKDNIIKSIKKIEPCRPENLPFMIAGAKLKRQRDLNLVMPATQHRMQPRTIIIKATKPILKREPAVVSQPKEFKIHSEGIYDFLFNKDLDISGWNQFIAGDRDHA